MAESQERNHQLLFLVYELRHEHPTIGCRDMYYMLRPGYIGRDRFERFCKENGLSSPRRHSQPRTTDSNGVIRFPNLSKGWAVTGLNQLWVSDITYFDLKGTFYYLTFIIDAFSRRIVGYSVSRRLFTEQTTLPAFEMALSLREYKIPPGLIQHSDGGGQYYDHEFLELTKKYGIWNSMCQYPWENGQAERINGVIKNNYLKFRTINSFETLVTEVDRSVFLYNNEKPHSALKKDTPVSFENKYICKGKTSDGEKSTTEFMAAGKMKDFSPSG
jgi:putative transposase